VILDALDAVQQNLIKPLILFFLLGFAVPLLRIPFTFPKALYQALTLYLLLAIGWHGGHELVALPFASLVDALGFLALGFVTNTLIGVLAYMALRNVTRLRRIDAAAVAGYYGSDSAGTFVTALGVLAAANIAYAPFMPVMLAVMEIPGCLVAPVLVARARRRGLDVDGNAADEPGHDPERLQEVGDGPLVSAEVLREVLLNPGLYLLFGGIVIGIVAGIRGGDPEHGDELLFVTLFQPLLCLFLIQIGITAATRLRDLRTAGTGFVAFGLVAPNLFAFLGLGVAHLWALATGQPLEPGTYLLFAVLCGSASYIALPAIQDLAFREASPTLPLAASLGLTFTWNVTLGIPLYLVAAQVLAG
jgi:uncharacterized protein